MRIDHVRVLMVALAVVGCRPAADADTSEIPSGSVAASDAHSEGAEPDRRGSSGTRTDGAGRTLVAVAMASPSDADPCEQLCGSLGECSSSDDPDRAVGLEFECLDFCVHAPDDAPAKLEFLACAANSDCEQLAACTTQKWAPLASAKVDPLIGNISASGSSACKASCPWIFSCGVAGLPPGEAVLGPAYSSELERCVLECDNPIDPIQSAKLTRYGECLIDHCSWEQQFECYAIFNE